MQPTASHADATVRVAAGDASVVEGNAGRVLPLKLPVTLSAPAPADVVVRWIAQPVTATPGDDYRAITKPNTTKIAAGRTSALITLGVLPDTLDEDDEQIEVTLLEVVGGPAVLGPRSTGRGTIIDDDPGEPAVGVGDVAVVEGDEGSSTVSVPFTLSEPLADAVKITWRVTPATASAGADYRDVAKPRTSRIDPGKTRALASLVVYGDGQYEGDEAAHVEVVDVTVIGGDATVGVSRPTGTLTIVDDESAPVIEPLHLGGVRNFLGTGDLAGILPPSVDTLANRPKSWLAISGQCAGKENGDRIMARSARNYYQQTSNPRGVNSGSGSFQCTTSGIVQNNPEFDPRGYFYGIEVPVGYNGGSIAIEAYDAAACASSAIDSTAVFQTTYLIRSNDSLNPTGASVLGAVHIAGGISSGRCAIPSTLTSGGFGAAAAALQHRQPHPRHVLRPDLHRHRRGYEHPARLQLVRPASQTGRRHLGAVLRRPGRSGPRSTGDAASRDLPGHLRRRASRRVPDDAQRRHHVRPRLDLP